MRRIANGLAASYLTALHEASSPGWLGHKLRPPGWLSWWCAQDSRPLCPIFIKAWYLCPSVKTSLTRVAGGCAFGAAASIRGHGSSCTGSMTWRLKVLSTATNALTRPRCPGVMEIWPLPSVFRLTSISARPPAPFFSHTSQNF